MASQLFGKPNTFLCGPTEPSSRGELPVSTHQEASWMSGFHLKEQTDCRRSQQILPVTIVVAKVNLCTFEVCIWVEEYWILHSTSSLTGSRRGRGCGACRLSFRDFSAFLMSNSGEAAIWRPWRCRSSRFIWNTKLRINRESKWRKIIWSTICSVKTDRSAKQRDRINNEGSAECGKWLR